eukprot:2311454-Heterocapsa_arctica.AAC.1
MRKRSPATCHGGRSTCAVAWQHRFLEGQMSQCPRAPERDERSLERRGVSSVGTGQSGTRA